MKRSWIKYIDIERLEPYPIQFANCDRLDQNDVVYIFDEVGSGKTVSSGIMAIDYLYNKKKEVLVITTNALSKKGCNGKYGQFLNDWIDKLPFKKLGLVDRISVVNNHYSNFKNKKKYGLVIIDEAQLFLNRDSMRYDYLTKNIRSDKVVFLTATPIKVDVCDLHTYCEIADNIIGKKVDRSWINIINTQNKEKKEIICNTFDESVPVTRYFKDTIMALDYEGFRKTQARRLLPELWKYSKDKSKLDTLLKKINDVLDKQQNSKFVIFSRFVEKEANDIKKFLCNRGFKEHQDDNSSLKSVKVITGENSYELSKYRGKENLPTVLILTYQIGEQGVNLPGFNYVINYHISSFPSALEQRFGRIDRMGKTGSIFQEIHMCFLISENCLDTNTWNFYCAVSIYMSNLISYLPSKNTILSTDMIKLYRQADKLIEEYIENIQRKSKECFSSQANNDIDSWDKELLEFIEENSIEYDKNDINADKNVLREVKEKLQELKRDLEKANTINTDEYEKIISTVEDKIFFMQRQCEVEDNMIDSLQTLDAIDDCGKNISENEKFKTYKKQFQERIKFPIVLENYKEVISQYFEKKFEELPVYFK